jgi:hypothetical protein
VPRYYTAIHLTRYSVPGSTEVGKAHLSYDTLRCLIRN